MARYNKNALKIAQLIRELLAAQADQLPAICLPESYWASLQHLVRKVERAHHRGWYATRRMLTENVRREINAIGERLQDISYRLRDRLEQPVVPTESFIFREILAVVEEFRTVDCDLDTREIRVRTEPIVLNEIDLGPFEIRLELDRLGEHSPYRVVALEPRPAESNTSVTHPHVQDEVLCEGEGRAAIRAALQGGRISDFFTIVHRILSTYAQGDAHVELADWSGIPCTDCGALAHEDDRYACEQCENTLCSDCTALCYGCNDVCCSSCLRACASCQESFCDACLTRCRKCGASLCSNCMSDGLCDTCLENEELEHEDEHDAAA